MQVTIDWDSHFDDLGAVLGGKIISVQPQSRDSGGRPAFFVNIDVGGQVRNLYIRGARDMFPELTSYQALKKEKTVMDWLVEHDVPIAAPVHLSKVPVALAMEAIDGEDDFEKVNNSEVGEKILTHYIEILADMHSHDVSMLEAAGFHAPSGDVETALHHFREFAIKPYQMSGTPQNPLCLWSQNWMTRNVPKSSGRLSLVQGDTGPGNFVYKGDRVKALVDWEVAHLGDAMEDLGCLRLRDVWTRFPCGIRKWLDYYQSCSGTEINEDAVRWYSIKLCIIHPFVLATAVYNPNTSATSAEWLAEYYSLSRIGLEEMAIHSGISLDKPQLPASRETLQSKYHDVLATALRDEVIVNIDDEFHRYRAEQSWRVAQYLRGTERYLEGIHEIEIDEISQITSQRVSGYDDAIAHLNQYIETASPDDDEELMRFFYRQQYRMESLMPGAIGRSEGRSFTPLD